MPYGHPLADQVLNVCVWWLAFVDFIMYGTNSTKTSVKVIVDFILLLKNNDFSNGQEKCSTVLINIVIKKIYV